VHLRAAVDVNLGDTATGGEGNGGRCHRLPGLEDRCAHREVTAGSANRRPGLNGRVDQATVREWPGRISPARSGPSIGVERRRQLDLDDRIGT
jgi:hypothetical protein